MPKGYWVALVEMTDPLRYRQVMEIGVDAFDRLGGRVLVRGTGTVKAGAPKTRVVIVEFDSFREAMERFDDPEFRAARDIFDQVSTYDFLIAEGSSEQVPPLPG